MPVAPVASGSMHGTRKSGATRALNLKVMPARRLGQSRKCVRSATAPKENSPEAFGQYRRGRPLT
jgi:hypothetical protein